MTRRNSSGVVDPDVDAAEPLDCLVRRREECCCVCDVGGDGDRLASEILNLRKGFLERGGVPRDQDEPRASPGEAPGGGAADTGGGAGDDDNLRRTVLLGSGHLLPLGVSFLLARLPPVSEPAPAYAPRR